MASNLPRPPGIHTRPSNTLTSLEFKREAAFGKRVYNAFRAIRIYQWSKNLLLLVPVLCLSEQIRFDTLAHMMIAVLVFGFASSAGYVFNDLLDRKRDARCLVRRSRPFASGALKPRDGIQLIVVLMGLALAISWTSLPLSFLWVLLAYLAATFIYSIMLKHIAWVDVLCLSSFYVLRIWSGEIASQCFPSIWLLVFAIFLFVNLATLKRYSELVREFGSDHPSERTYNVLSPTRPYGTFDLSRLRLMAFVSGLIAAGLYIVFIYEHLTFSAFNRPFFLWLAGAVLAAWVMYAWTIAIQGRFQHNPIWYVLRDPVSLCCGCGLIGLYCLAR